MKVINIFRGIYHYYNSGRTNQVSYISTIGALILLIFIHIVQITICLQKYWNIDVDFFPFPDVHRSIKYLIMAVYLAPIFLILTKVFPRQKLINHNLSEKELKKGKYIFWAYLTLNVLVVIALIADKIKFGKS